MTASLILPLILSGMRYMVGSDYPEYVKIADNVVRSESFWSIITTSQIAFEVGAKLLMKFGELFGVASQMFFVISAFLTVLFLWLGCKGLNTRYASLIYTALLFVVFISTFSQARQGIAISMGFYAAVQILNGRILRGISAIVLASLFHFSALLLLLFVPIYIISQERWFKESTAAVVVLMTTMLSVVLTLAAVLILPKVALLSKYGEYITGNTDIVGLSDYKDLFVIYLPVFLVGIIALYVSKEKESNERLRQLVAYMILALVLAYVGPMFSLLNRATWYMLPLTIVLGTISLSEISKNVGIKWLKINERLVVCSLVLFISIAYFVYTYVLNFGGAYVLPYATYLSVLL